MAPAATAAGAAAAAPAAAAAAAGLPRSLLRRLEVLQCPLPSGVHTPQFENLVLWLEETQIRCLPRQQRQEKLRSKGSSWWRAFLQVFVLWIFSEGTLKGVDPSEAQQQLEKEQQQQEQQQQQQRAAAAEAAKLMRAPLADALSCMQLPPLPSDASPEETLAALQAVEAGIAAETRAPAREGSYTTAEARQLLLQLPLLVGPPSGGSGGPQRGPFENQFAAAARLLQLQQLQQTQDSVNEALERMQLLTADPKTDHRLAKVGF
ncbi:hypothetical protein, conserved [Eimeria necatrix]|uniref:Uncharacterized protein n=1 Tax=Eimeria necatrix TaxID=51315 RepID=U6N413_9EIME|nr:hypothetical protein, conserved [Eimeria necatrix]CDJ69479.1 hypothetical protein, conserved [Eimeria necatrix]